MMYQRTVSFRFVAFAAFLFGACLVFASLAKPAAAEPELTRGWQIICQEYPCAEFPMDHLTANFGGQYYYFPMRRLTNPDWQTIDPKQEPFEIIRYNTGETSDMPRRAFSRQGFSIEKCCDEMFRWFGMPEFGGKNRGANSIGVYPYLPPSSFSRREHRKSLYFLVYGRQVEMFAEIDPPQIPIELRTDYSPSFWRLAGSWDDMMLVSKEPILAESYGVMRCRSILCNIDTLLPTDTSKPPPLKVQIHLWSPNLENDGAERIAAFIAAADELLSVARVKP